ncbi:MULTISPECIES: FecR domain-containing protein [Pseudomonas]|uniref:FecR family protein n=1 Tax=Pseudomonas pergaminensis TaxID=2853159 RepID=A0ABD8B421_9PSED|nr:FecR family protein [Pseudomonas lurida]
MKKSVDTIDSIAEQAIEWMVYLRSGEATAEDESAFLTWRAQRPEHEQACTRIESTLGKMPSHLSAVSSQSVRSVLLAPSRRREFLRTALSVAVVGTMGGWLVNRTYPVGDMLADVTTRTSQRRTLQLSDGSSLTLNARSAANINIDMQSGSRKIRLVSGEMILNVAPSQQPFLVQIGRAIIEVKDGRFSLREVSDGFRVVALNGGVRATARGDTKLLSVGQGATFGPEGFRVFPVSIGAESSWLRGVLEVNDQPLSVVIDALRNYRTGIVRLDPAAASLRVSGLFPLDDTDFAIEALAQTMPIVVRRTTGYWVNISGA